ncbi:MAG: hypothetical protein AAFV80_10195, partial [Bacteroidota bacterium]
LYLPLSLWLLAQMVYQSFQVLILYHRRFTLAGMVELIGFSVVLVSVWSVPGNLPKELLVWAFAASFIVRSMLLFATMNPGQPTFGLDRTFLRACFPFFLIGLSGMLQSKTDLYIVNFMMEDVEVGLYQIVITIYLFYQAAAGFLLEPLARNLYRAKSTVFRKLGRSMAIFGLLLLVLTLPLQYLVFEWFYGFPLSWDYYLYGCLFAFPVFLYLPIIYRLYKVKKEGRVMMLNFMAAVVNGGYTWILLSQMGLTGALLGSALAQWFLLAVYAFWNSKLKKEADAV